MPATLQHVRSDQKGFTLLLMIVLLAAFLSIAMGFINILLGQVIIVGQAGESFNALYAVDIGVERALYRDRVQRICGTSSCSEAINLPNNACYQAIMTLGPSASCQGPGTRCISVTGQNFCGGAQRFVQRKFSVTY